MKQRKEIQKPTQPPKKSIQELTEQISHIIGKDPKKAAQAIEFWVKEPHRNRKRAA